MKQLNRYLLTILGLGWLSFMITGIVLNQVFAVPNFVLLIERSYCPSQQWQQVVEEYIDLYRQNQQHLVKIESVVLFNDLGEEVLTTVPTPEELRGQSTYGRSSPQREAELRKAYGQVKVIRCL
ncbi:MAG: hypothetical protein F6K25_30235 [Okeania sp. SIO2G4]|uniref:hypothetical protein n=1 Tax=unclassified Okeania TaxID=2634635 RepID=UPI0013BC3E25|nr:MULTISPECIES: hypothetical protein [unclassified Okeania]NEP41933.1 hypothetical protein [Okeania sp. SIO2H7]NEP75858.1 hypothetical protein [Okeania sp. SIO2G5]NEP97036.1 hypothetical protein [Okeania sp. SIO2F5]NEQ94684.1 hypothetical protein [Okeania sp. SIO2G4]